MFLLAEGCKADPDLVLKTNTLSAHYCLSSAIICVILQRMRAGVGRDSF